MKPPAKRKKPKPSWRITALRKRGETLCTVEADNADEAIALAIELLSITDPERRRRLVAQKISS